MVAVVNFFSSVAGSLQLHTAVTSRGVLYGDWSTPFYRWLRLCSENISLVFVTVLCLSLLTFTNESYTHTDTNIPSKLLYIRVTFLIHNLSCFHSALCPLQ